MVLKLLIVNLLTLIRIIGTFFLIFIYHNYGSLYVAIFALIFYLTDSIDGILARRWQVSTFFGAMFDGIADKILTIVNFAILYLITPYSLISIILELFIILIVIYKYINNYNIKSNIIGKVKVWILTISIVLTFLVSDINKITFLPTSFKKSILSFPLDKLYIFILLPTIIMEVITVISYIRELFKQDRNSVNIKVKEEKVYKKRIDYFKNVWFNPEFYRIHKNDSHLKDLRCQTKGRP